jgi:hypothetical protein
VSTLGGKHVKCFTCSTGVNDTHPSIGVLVRFFTHILTRFIANLTPLNGSHSPLIRVICCETWQLELQWGRAGTESKWVGKQEEAISLHKYLCLTSTVSTLSVSALPNTYSEQVPCV